MDFNLATIHEAVAAEIPERECIVWGEQAWTWADTTERTRRFANYLCSRGLGCHIERDELQGWESGQDQVALCLYNSNEYLEGMLGAYKARCAPFNVNYRYVADELLYLLNDSGAKAIVYHAEFAPRLAEIRDQLPNLKVFIQVADDSGNEMLPGAIDYEAALAGASPERPELIWSPDDLYILYTGGTTGMPKGVLWRQQDIFMGAMLPPAMRGNPPQTPDEVVLAAKSGGLSVLPVPPFMHGAAHWVAFAAWFSGSPVIIQRNVRTLDPDDVWTTIQDHRAQVLLLVGDAFARPLLDQLAKKNYDLSSLLLIASGGAILNETSKAEFTDRLGAVMILDALGSSEAGVQGANASAVNNVSTGIFTKDANTVVLNADLTAPAEPGSEESGWIAQKGIVPLGYLGDPDKSARTFPVINGVRYSVPGDRVRLVDETTYELLGRDSVTINTGGEKVFAEEVEGALKRHPSVFDAVVAGRPSDRWGSEVVAVVQLREGAATTPEELSAEAAKHIARYKLPKAYVFVDTVVRGPNGKADYRWARETVLKAAQ